jgi:hypothetical protein
LNSGERSQRSCDQFAGSGDRFAGEGDLGNGQRSQRSCDQPGRGGDCFARGRDSLGAAERHREESAPEVGESDEGDCDYTQRSTEAGRYGPRVGEGGGLATGGYGGLHTEEFEPAGFGSEGIEASKTNQSSGAKAQTHATDSTAAGPNSVGASSFHRSWLDMDRVDPCQPTQSFNVGASTHGQESVHWSAAHSVRAKPVRIDIDEYVEQSECNVDVGLTLQGQFY